MTFHDLDLCDKANDFIQYLLVDLSIKGSFPLINGQTTTYKLDVYILWANGNFANEFQQVKTI